MLLSINNHTIFQVERFHSNGPTLYIVFERDHRYTSMEKIEEVLNAAGLSVLTYTFEGGNETNVLCALSESLKGMLDISIML